MHPNEVKLVQRNGAGAWLPTTSLSEVRENAELLGQSYVLALHEQIHRQVNALREQE